MAKQPHTLVKEGKALAKRDHLFEAVHGFAIRLEGYDTMNDPENKERGYADHIDIRTGNTGDCQYYCIYRLGGEFFEGRERRYAVVTYDPRRKNTSAEIDYRHMDDFELGAFIQRIAKRVRRVNLYSTRLIRGGWDPETGAFPFSNRTAGTDDGINHTNYCFVQWDIANGKVKEANLAV